jgi:4-hydroxy-2-oxoheptanedioate aldolase
LNRDGQSRPNRLGRNALKQRLQSEQFIVGTFLEIVSPAVVELLGLAGFDFVVIDREHGAIDLKDTEDMIRAGSAADVSVMVRVPCCESNQISQPLDMGAAGVHVPQIETAEAAKAVVAASKYHPLGKRGLQPYVRSASYRSYTTKEYLSTANDDTLVVVHVEGVEGVANLESILQVEGIDVVFIGPYDLSQSLGIPGQVNDARVTQAMVQAVRLARRHKKWVGTYSDHVETALAYRDLGIFYITISIDANILLTAARSIVVQMSSPARRES